MNPKISFIIAAFNEEEYLKECIESCLNQSYENIEVCVTDDGSIDRTWDILQDLESSNVKIARFDHNKGKVSAFNKSYSMASGAYIAIIGADDINLTDRIHRQLAFLLKNGIDLTWGGFIHIDGAGVELPSYYSPLKTHPQKTDILQDNFIPGNTVFLRKKISDTFFPIPTSLQFEDWWTSFHIIFQYKYKICCGPVIKYRIHENNTVGNQNGLYSTLRRKNIRRHLAYHDLFAEKLQHFKAPEKYKNLNQLMKKYKQACLSDSFFERIGLFLSSLKYFSLRPRKIFIKYICVVLFGLKMVGVFFK